MMSTFKNRTPSLAVFTTALLLTSTSALSSNAQINNSLFYGGVDIATVLSSDEEHDQNDLINNIHYLDIYLNNALNNRDEPIQFVLNSHTKKAEPCLNQTQFEKLDLIEMTPTKQQDGCILLSDISEYSRWEYDKSELQLSISMPQVVLKLDSKRKGIDKELWDEGINAAYVKHRTSYSYQAYHEQEDYNQLSGSINMGANWGLMQLRHDGYFRYDFENERLNYQAHRAYLQVPVSRYESQLTMGENYTAGRLFGSLGYTGFNLATDSRMWSDHRKGYAPRVTGVALSNARIEIKQGKNTIYETNVPPGPFEIDDLYSIPQQGDLTVNIHEADGSIKTTTVPYSVLPNSLRFGNSEYNVVVGKARDYKDINALFLEGTLQQGYSNIITTNYGYRFADRYRAYLLGGVFSSSYGAFGLNATFSQTRVVDNEPSYQGWQTELNYGRTFDSGFNITMIALRNSTKGYRSLENVFGLRQSGVGGNNYSSNTLGQRNHFRLMVNQSLGDFGQLALSANMSDYYENRPTSYNYSARYNQTLWGVSFDVNVDRQRISRYATGQNEKTTNEYQTVVSLGLSVPLDRDLFRLGHSYNGDESNSRASYSGSVGRDFSYSLTGTNSASGTYYSVSANQRTPIGSLSASYSNGTFNASGNFSTVFEGTMLLHDGGVTIGPYTGDSFALVEADGAKGASVDGWGDSKIDSFGYAIYPILSPYRYNDINLDTANLEGDVELTKTHKKVVPYSGAVVKVKFNTIKGRAFLIDTTLSEGGVPPLGSDVLTADNRRIGMVGQAGVIYARLGPDDTNLKLKWGKSEQDQCSMTVEYREEDSSPISKIDAVCG